MASCQCYEPVAHPCNQDQQNHSLDQKSEVANRGLKKEGTQNGKAAVKCQTQCQSGKQAEGGVVKTGTLCSSTTGMISTPAPASNAKTSRRSGGRKKGLLQRIKDGISGHSDGGGGSSSSSESDSDDEKCGRRKN